MSDDNVLVVGFDQGPVDQDRVRDHRIEELVVAQVGSSALFASRFREVATRALVLPLSSFRRRSPLWLQRLRAAGYERPFTPLEVGIGDYVKTYLSQPDPYR